MTNQKVNGHKGFTIIESLIAITILVTAIMGATSAVQTGISSYILSKDQITAFYLAQEGIEQLRNMRDENSLTNDHWLSGIAESSGDPCYFGKACTVDVIAGNIPIECISPGNCPILRQDTLTGFFGYNSLWPTTVFKREITLRQIESHEVSVKVTISWSKGIINRQFVAVENLFDWQ